MIQILLLLAAFALVLYFFTNRKKANAKAWVKLGFVVLVIAAVWAILRPDDVTVVANWLGVDRGTDLMLYTLIIAFFFRASPYPFAKADQDGTRIRVGSRCSTGARSADASCYADTNAQCVCTGASIAPHRGPCWS